MAGRTTINRNAQKQMREIGAGDEDMPKREKHAPKARAKKAEKPNVLMRAGKAVRKKILGY